MAGSNGKAGRVVPGSTASTPVNTKPRFRITLRIGDIAAICGPAGTDAGRQHRMQILGYFYEALNSPDLAARYAVAWPHLRYVIGHPLASEADTDAFLADSISRNVIVGVARGTAPPVQQLPAPGHFARIMLPGTHCLTKSAFLDDPLPHAHRFKGESDFFDANWRVGAIPIIARVEQEGPPGKWSAAPAGLHVHFQLIVPNELAAGGVATCPPLRAVTVVHNATPAPHGPARYVANEVSRIPKVVGDPQVDNCPDVRGGKRRATATGADYFETANRAGFNDLTPGFPVAAKSSHKLAVEALTNANGDAGAIFRPSRQGGDRFRLRAFLDPNGTVASDGTERSAVKDDTGTMVVWRSVRISRYVQFDYPTGIDANTRDFVGGDLPKLDLNKYNDDFARCYMELIIEPTAARQDQRIGDAEYQQAIRYARTTMHFQGVAGSYKLPTLFPETNTTAGLIDIPLPADYNASVSGTPAAIPTDWASLVEQILDAFVDYYSGTAISGLCIVQAPAGDDITVASGLAADSASNPNLQVLLSSSGMGTPTRGCFLFWGVDVYTNKSFPGGISQVRAPYGAERDLLHEIGHVLFLPHHWRNLTAAGVPDTAGAFPLEHDYHDYCIMGYLPCNGDFCGRCNLKLRGWDTSGIPKNG